MLTYDLKTILQSHARESNMNKSLAVLTSGGDSQGMNAAIRSVVRVSTQLGLNVYIVKEGYYGLITGEDYIVKANWFDVSSILSLGGTFIGTKRCKEFMTKEGRLEAARNLILLDISNLIVIGGDGSLFGANIFRKEWSSYVNELLKCGLISQEASEKCARLNLVGIVGSIDNDFSGTDMTIGADTALHRIIEAIDSIASTAFSHQRTFIMEVMGRTCGYLAIKSALMCEADYMFIKEWPQKLDWPEKLCKNVSLAREMGKRLNIIIVSEGAVDENGNTITSEMVKNILVDRLNQDARITVLGHVQRGGSPSAFDRTLATRMGAHAVLSILKASDETKVMCLKSNAIVESSLVDCVQATMKVAEAIKNNDYEKALEYRGPGFKNNLETFKVMISQKIGCNENGKRTLIFNVGGSSNGINALTYSIVRATISSNNRIFGAKYGVDGVIQNKIVELKWTDVIGWLNRGGVELGITRTVPDSKMLADMAKQMGHYKFNSCIIAGGLDALRTGLRMYETREQFEEFRVPIIVVPVTYSNNIPGTDFSLGTDTALNQVVKLCDIIRQSTEGHKPRVFVVEVPGGKCGYLTTMAALACGADRSYIPEENFNIEDLMECVYRMARKFAMNKINRGLVLRSESANSNYTTSFIGKLMAEEGKGLFATRESILGSIASGGDPSPFDRSFALKEGQKTVEWINKMQAQSSQSQMLQESAVLLGFQNNGYTFTSLIDLKSSIDSERSDSKVWWMKYRALLKMLEDCKYWKTI